MIYGKACTGNYASLEKLAGKIPVFPRVSNERSMIYIENLCEFLYRIIRGDADGNYCPQNSQYVNTSDMVARIAESYGRSIWLVPGFEWIIGKLAGRVNIFSKVFGSLTYDRKLSFQEEVGEYEVVDFLESIKKSKESL
jgi:UDP-glucose 4-epimerase